MLDFEKPLAELESRIIQIRELAEDNDVDVSAQIHQLESRAQQLRQEIFTSLSPSQRIQVARTHAGLARSTIFRQLAMSG